VASAVEATLAREQQEDQRTRRVAIAGALIFHLLLLVLNLPEIDARVARPPEREIIVLTTTRFTQPTPEPQELPVRQERRLPIPDPTPQEPEPIRLPGEEQPEIGLYGDLVLNIPEAPPRPESAGPIRVGGAVRPPVKIYAPAPRYTEIARRARIEGVVIVEAVIDKTGKVTGVVVLKTLPMGLDQSAVEAVRRWRFEPATLNGRPVAVLYNLTVNFRLQG
jgi:protein TonB